VIKNIRLFAILVTNQIVKNEVYLTSEQVLIATFTLLVRFPVACDLQSSQTLAVMMFAFGFQRHFWFYERKKQSRRGLQF
jgi:hypothetical protein